MFREYKRLLLCVLSVYLSLYTMAEDFKTYKSGTYFKMKTIRRDLNRSIITKTYMTDSISVCSYKCVKLKSLSLYFVTVEKICFCNNGLDGSDISDSKKTGSAVCCSRTGSGGKTFHVFAVSGFFHKPFPNEPLFLRVCSTSLFKTLECFLPFWRSFHHFHKS